MGFKGYGAGCAAGAILLLCHAAAAETIPGVVSSVTPELSISTLGLGPELDARFSGVPFGMRLGANFFSLQRNLSTNDVRYHGSIDLANGGIVGDWYPFHGNFRLSGGFKINGNAADVSAHPVAGTLVINHHAYSAQGSQVNGTIDYDSFAPYLGLGYQGQILDGAGFGGPTVGIDLGAMYQGSPKTSLHASGPLASMAGFAGNLAVEQQSLQSKVKDYTVYPVLQVTVGWRF